MSKRHEIQFETERGKFTVQTDDIESLSEQPWFREFLGIDGAKRDISHLRALSSAQEEIEELRGMVRTIRQEQQRLLQQDRPVERAAQGQQGQHQERSQREELQQPVQPVQQAPPQMQQRSRTMAQSFMDIDPGSMTAEIWGSLSPEQRAQWMQAHNLRG